MVQFMSRGAPRLMENLVGNSHPFTPNVSVAFYADTCVHGPGTARAGPKNSD